MPAGPNGTRETLKHMRKLVHLGKLDPFNRDLANTLTSSAPQKNWLAEMRAIFFYVRDGIRYALDTWGVEVLQSARVTVTLGYGDCDDKCVALATLLESVGHPCRFVALGFGEIGQYTHVIVETSLAGETPWIALDATEPVQPGWFPEGVTCAMVAPIGDDEESSTGCCGPRQLQHGLSF